MDKELNLKIFNKNYRSRKARVGLYVLNRLIRSNDDYSLQELLRNHEEKTIRYFFEIEHRDNIDDLLDYYGLIEIGILGGYFPSDLNRSMRNEIKLILGNKWVQRYYREYYPVLLPQLLYDKIDKDFVSTSKFESTIKEYWFEKFLLLNDSIRNDKDVDQFLWFLDDGKTGNFSIVNFWEVLSDRYRIEYKLGSEISHPLNHCLWGFIKYLEFLHEYAKLLMQTDNDRLIQSAFWSYQSYWFDNMKEKLSDVLELGIKNIRMSIESSNQNELFANKNSIINNEKDYYEWRGSAEALYDIEKDIFYLTNSRLKTPILEALNNQ